MTWQTVQTAIQQAIATAAGLPLSSVEWSHTGRDGEWTGYPRIKLTPMGNWTLGIPEERETFDPVAFVMRRAVWSVDLFRVQIRIECDSTAMGDGAPFSPADRLGKVIRTPDVTDALHGASVALQTLREFGPFQATAENRELSVSMAEALFQVNIPVDTTPEGGVDWFNIVQVHYDEGTEAMGDITVYGPSIEALLIPGAGLRVYRSPTPLVGTGAELRTPLVVPAALPLTSGHRYRVSGVALVRSAGGAAIATIAIRDAILARGPGGWSEVRGPDIGVSTYAGWDSFFTTTAHLPGLGFTTGTLELWSQPISGQSVIAEFHGTIADIGAP